MALTHKVELTAAEISNLWTSYQNDSMSVCVLKYFITNCDDEAICSVLQYALSVAELHVKKLTDIFLEEGYPVPIGFTDNDVNTTAPRLYTNKFCLLYVLEMGKFGLSSYGFALSLVVREDIVEYYSTCLEETKKLHNDAKKLAIEKGVLIFQPAIPKHKSVDFVKKQNFLSGYFGNRRPLLAIEIANLHYNAERNALGIALIIGFSQVAKEKEIRKFFERGRDLSKKHLSVFNSLLEEENYVNGVVTLGQEVTDSTSSPFSDKLMMYHITMLTVSAIGQYGISMASAPRHDLGVLYERLLMEIFHYCDDGANIMINHGWVEQPPIAPNREELAKGGD